MDIRNLVDKCQKLEAAPIEPVLNPNDNIFSALNTFIKSRATCLAVFEKKEFLGVLHLSDLAKTILSLYQKERENLYDLKTGIQPSLIKLDTVFAKLEEVKFPQQRNRYIKMGKEALVNAKNRLK